MANEKNLIPQAHVLTVEELSRGGVNSARARKKRKAFKQVFNELLAGELTPDLAQALNEKSSALGIDTSQFTVAEYIGLAQVVKAVSGDTKAFEVIRDTVGEKPAERQQLDISSIPKISLKRKE